VHSHGRITSRCTRQLDGMLIGRDLSEYDYISVGKDGFVLINVKSMTSMTQLSSDIV
jgi:hypothetical protein